jgi:hypothetical protein
MALFGWFGKNKKNEDVEVKDRKNNILQDTAAAAAFAEAGEFTTARSMIDKASATRKILVIGREERFSDSLIEYSIDMAKRLGFELVALNVTDAPLSLSADKKDAATALFKNSSKEHVDALKKRAEDNGIAFIHQVEIGRQDEVVEKLHAKYPTMRYVLTEPNHEVAQETQGNISIPVFDLGSFHGAAA